MKPLYRFFNVISAKVYQPAGGFTVPCDAVEVFEAAGGYVFDMVRMFNKLERIRPVRALRHRLAGAQIVATDDFTELSLDVSSPGLTEPEASRVVLIANPGDAVSIDRWFYRGDRITKPEHVVLAALFDARMNLTKLERIEPPKDDGLAESRAAMMRLAMDSISLCQRRMAAMERKRTP